MSVEVDPQRFEELVGEALDSIPPELARLMNNVAVFVEEQSPEGQDLFGLYEGVPLTERDGGYAGVLPDRITIFRGPLCDACDTEAQVVEEVRTTVVHEIAHHFGIDDARLQELGWG